MCSVRPSALPPDPDVPKALPLETSPPFPPPPDPLWRCAEGAETKKLASLSQTLRSHTRDVGPKVVGREGSLHHIYAPSSPRAQAVAFETDEVRAGIRATPPTSRNFPLLTASS